MTDRSCDFCHEQGNDLTPCGAEMVCPDCLEYAVEYVHAYPEDPFEAVFDDGIKGGTE